MRCQNCGFEFAIGPSTCPNCGSPAMTAGGWQSGNQGDTGRDSRPAYGQADMQQDPRMRNGYPAREQDQYAAYPSQHPQDPQGQGYAPYGQGAYGNPGDRAGSCPPAPQDSDPRTREAGKRRRNAGWDNDPYPPQGNQPPDGYVEGGGGGNGHGIAALIFGLISFIVVPIVTSIMAIAFANVSIRKHGKNGAARAGKILGAISLILYACVIALYVLVLTGTISLL